MRTHKLQVTFFITSGNCDPSPSLHSQGVARALHRALCSGECVSGRPLLNQHRPPQPDPITHQDPCKCVAQNRRGVVRVRHRSGSAARKNFRDAILYPPFQISGWYTRSISSPAGGRPFGGGGTTPSFGEGTTSPIHLIRATPIRAQIEPGFVFSRPNRSPYRPPFLNNPKSAVFLELDEIKRSYKRVFQADPGAGWVFVRSRKKRP